MKLDYLEFILENCDTIRVEGKNICLFRIEDIETSFYGNSNYAIKQERANLFCIELKPQANKVHYELEEEDWKTTVFTRLKQHSDITGIRFKLDGQEYYYVIDWNEEDEYNNSYQTSFESSLGYLYIKISRNKSFSDCFPDNYIEHADAFNFSFVEEGGEENV